jgi:hypothetical protein
MGKRIQSDGGKKRRYKKDPPDLKVIPFCPHCGETFILFIDLVSHGITPEKHPRKEGRS